MKKKLKQHKICRKMKTTKYLFIAWLLTGISGIPEARAQQVSITHSQPVRIETFNGTSYHTTINYYDGLERQIQSISVGVSAQNGKDLVSFQQYDRMGRADSIVYLPFVAASSTNNGAKISDPVSAQQSFYQNYLPATDPDRNYAFAVKQYEESPRGLIVKEGGFGQSKNIDSGDPTHYQYMLNDASQIKKFSVNGYNHLIYEGFYPANVLKVRRIYTGENAENSDTYEYVDQTGKLIATETVVDENDRRITYYAYDDLGRKRFIIPPIQEALITVPGSVYSHVDLRKYCFYTEFDNRGNPIREWYPGGICTSNVYDTYGRLVLSQDPVMAAENKWSFVKYDSQNRAVISGITTIAGTAETVAAALKAHNATLSSTEQVFEERGNDLHGYTNRCYPTNVTSSQVMNVTYYDDYQWIADTTTYGFSSADALEGMVKTENNVIGLTTGTKTKVIGIETDQWLTSVTYYDDYGNAIQTISDLYPGGTEIVSNVLDFNDQVLQTKVKQTVDNTTYEYNKWFDYDSYGRLLKIRQKITGDPQNEIVLSEFAYDDLGQLVSKKIHGNLEETTYQYDINTREIAALSPSFSYRIGYDKSLLSGVAGRTDGMISQITWGYNSTGDQKAYAFTYDKLQQYLSASFYEKSGTSWTSVSKYRETIGSYDKNGNILSLQRTDANGTLLHNLTYTYGSSTDGNILTGVTGSSEFLYDANGNMTKDGQTGVQIEYNILNLPQRIYKGADQISYIYSAAGQKLATQTGSSLTYYRSVMVYSKNGTDPQQLLYMIHPEGLVAKEGSSWVYKYFKTDYLGNTRALLAVRNGTLVNEGQNTDYYPLGYAHALSNLHLNKYLFAGKEYQDASIGGSVLGLYDFHARYYNPLLGRWFNPDPANQLTNPYIFCGNNPLMYVDPDGQFFWLAPLIGALIGAATYTASVAFSEGGFSNWSWGSFFQSMGIGALSATATYGVGAGFDKLGLMAAGGKFFVESGRALSHGLVQGGISLLNGDNFWDGFSSGILSSGFGSTKIGGTVAAKIAYGGLSGGIGAITSGGNFWKGLGSGLIVSSFNHVIERGAVKLYKPGKRIEAWRDAWETSEKNYVETSVYGLETEESLLSWEASSTQKRAEHIPHRIENGKVKVKVQRLFKTEWVPVEDYTHTHVIDEPNIGISCRDEDIFKVVKSAHIINLGIVYRMLGNYRYEPIGLSFITK